MAIDRKGRPVLGEFWAWQMQTLKPFRRKSYRALCALPAETEIAGPLSHPEIRFFVRRSVAMGGDDLTPGGTVAVSVCVEFYEDG